MKISLFTISDADIRMRQKRIAKKSSKKQKWISDQESLGTIDLGH